MVWALQESEYDFEPVDVSATNWSYWELLADLWRGQECFALVEHDIVVTPGILGSFESCDQPWCVAKYPYLRGVYWGLGCTRFDAVLMRDFPDLMDEVAAYEVDKHGRAHWCTLDAAITQALRRRLRAWPHVHGEVQHLGNQLPSHGCRT